MLANIFFGSEQDSDRDFFNIVNPYSQEIVSRYPKCTAEDTKRALEIAKKSFQTDKSFSTVAKDSLA